MYNSKAAFFNAVLTHLGERRINDANSAEDSAVVIRNLYQPSLDELLQLYPWQCASARRRLARVSGENYSGYEYAYQLPEDCLAVREILNKQYKAIEVGYLREGRILYCDLADVVITYTKRAELSDLDSMLQEAAALLIASKAAYKITQNQSLGQTLYALYQKAEQDAEYSDGIQRLNQREDR